MLAGGEDDIAQGQAQCLALHDTLEGVSSWVGWAVSTCCPAVVQWSRQCLSCVTNRAGVAIARSRLSQDHELVREVIASWAG